MDEGTLRVAIGPPSDVEDPGELVAYSLVDETLWRQTYSCRTLAISRGGG